jgi:hypothetical protein
MAAKLGPKIINDQLVLSLDAADANSYAGEPTTNNLSSSDVANANAAPNRTNQYSNIAVTKEVVNYSSDRPHVYRIKSTNATGYFSMGYNSSIQNQSGSVYAFSFDYKVVRADTGTGTNLGAGSFIVYGNGYKLPTASNIASNISSSEVELHDGWKRVTKTYTCGYTGYNQTRQDLTTGDAGDFEVLIDNIQFEDKTYSTPFADLTRPNQIDFITHGDVGSGTTFTDSSVNNLTLTSANGASHAGTGPFGGSAMSFVRASSQQITSPSNSLCDFGTGDFTIDFWFNMNSGTATNTRMHALNIGSGSSTNVSFDFNDSGYGIWLYWMSGGSNHIRQSGNYHNDGLWHHCAFVRDNGTCRLWIDGAYIGGVSYATQIGATQSLYIGSASGGQHWDGYIDEVRIIKGTALWKGASDFSVPTSRGKNASLLDASSNNNNGSLINGTGTSTTHYRDGQVIMPLANAYLEFDGTDNYVSTSFGDNHNPATNPISYTVWVKTHTNSSGNKMFLVQSDWGGNHRAYFGTISGVCGMGIQSSGWGNTQGGDTITTNTWNHMCIVFEGLTCKWYRNGSLMFSKSYTSFTFSQNLSIGSARPYSTSYDWDGEIAQVLVHNKALTAAEVLNNYNTTKSRFN